MSDKKNLTHKEKSGTFAYMRKLVLLFCLFSFVGFGQKIDVSDRRKDSMSVSHLYLNLRNGSGRSAIKTYWVNEKLKFTLRPTVNRRMVQRLKNGGVLTKESLNEMGSEEVLSLAAYDIRCKYYFNERSGLILRVFATGVDTDGYFYTLGYSKKF